jgi:phospholipid/cholesterol/gamma-HCH transport system substrate-binding protein
MRARIFGFGAVAAGVVVLAAILLSGGGKDDYTVHLQMRDALGLRDGSKVVAGGVTVGRVQLSLGGHDRVDATLKIDKAFAPIGKDAAAVITSVNLLGEKSLELDPGNRTNPAASGSTLRADRITPSTDLDQVLDVLDSGTRDRLTILVNAAGQAFTGRRGDFASILKTLPTGLQQGTKLLERVDGDHRTLVDLVAKSDRFVATLAHNRVALADMLDTFGQAAETSATRRPQLRQTLRQLPGTLQTAQHFLDDLRNTTVPLGPAARQLASTAAPLDSTLVAVGPFTKAAKPTLDKATAVAPTLTHLADGATPVIRRAVPTLQTLAAFSSSLEPISTMLNLSANNIIGVAANWAHAIQGRDSLGHVFRAEVAVTPQTVEELVSRLLATQKHSSKGSAKPKLPVLKPTPPKQPKLPQLPKLPDKVTAPVQQLTAPVTKAVDGVKSLLDYLLKP